MVTETVSFRLKKELKDLAKRHKIDISKIAKEKVEEELKRLQMKEQEKMFEKAAEILQKFSKDEIVAAVRKSRESR